MTQNAESNTSSISTTFRWHLEKIEGHPQGTGIAPKAASGLRRKSGNGWWRRGQVVITFKGGPEASYLFTCEGRHWRYCGHDSLHDVMTHLARVVKP